MKCAAQNDKGAIERKKIVQRSREEGAKDDERVLKQAVRISGAKAAGVAMCVAFKKRLIFDVFP